MLIPLPLPSIDAALRDVRSKDPRARARAAESLAQADEARRPEALEALRPLLEDTEGAVRFAAVAALGRLRDGESVEAIVSHFDDRDPLVRQAALIAAADLGDRRAGPALRDALTAGNPEVRFQAAVSYAMLCPEEAVGPLVEALDDGDAEVRQNAATALGDLLADATDADRTRANRALARAVEDRSPAVRFEAALALVAGRDERAGPVLLAALDDSQRAIDAAEALGELRYEPARERLAALAGRRFRSPELRVVAAGALARLGDPRGAETLRKVLTGWRSDVRPLAVDVVGRVGLTELAAVVAGLLERPRGADPVVVVQTLARLAGSSEQARTALELAAGRDDEAGAAARHALAPRATTDPP